MRRDSLLQVLQEARVLLARPENRFDWSSWKDMDAALAEVDGLIASVSCNVEPDLLQLRTLFAPTGPMQEVSVSSGWGDAFLTLAERLDAALR